jgi:DNA-binding transcriptional LysR family regulator
LIDNFYQFANTLLLVELRHLRYFVALADVLNFGRAAAHLRIAQPSLSHQIRQLETELQAGLLVRTTRRVQLTEAGRLFLEQAREILAHADRAAVVARRANRGEMGTLRVGCAHWMDSARILSSLGSFHDRNPGIHFDLHSMSAPLQIAALRDERLDVGYVRPPVNEPSLDSEILLREPFVVALPARHRLVARERIAVSDLASEAFILLPREEAPIFHDLVLEACREAGFVPNVAHEIGSPQMVLGLVATGVGISLVPASVCRARPRGVAFRPLGRSPRVLQTAIAWRREHAAPPLIGFLETARGLWPGG